MATNTMTKITPAAGADPIDVLVPPARPWWIRLAAASIIIGAVGFVGYGWNFGLLRPAPDCCGSGTSGPQIGLSNHEGAVTVTGYFFNSSTHPISIVGATANLPGARVIEVKSYDGTYGWEMPPESLVDFPVVAEGRDHDSGGQWFAISFVPERCDGDADDWGTLTLELETVGDHWYPTFGRSLTLPDALVPGGAGQLSVLQPASLDGEFNNIDRPLEAACVLLGR